MNKDKGVIGLGLILAIVLGIAVVGGGAYYLGQNKNNYKQEEVNNLLNVPEIDQQVNQIQNIPVVNNYLPVITVLSPNGGEVYGSGQKMTIKWSSVGKDMVSIFLRPSNGDWCYITEVPSSTSGWTFVPYDYKCKNISRIISSGQYKISLILWNSHEMTPEPGTAFSDYNSYNQDSSDSYFSINSSKVSTINYKTYLNTQYGFSFDYPNTWKTSEDKNKKEVIVSTDDMVDRMAYPSWSISFKSTDKNFFNTVRPTKMGVITYSEKESALFADDRCIKAEDFGFGTTKNNLIKKFIYGGSMMSDPAYSNSAILTTDGNIIIVDSRQGVVITPDIDKQLSLITNSFKLLNNNKVFIPECSK